MKPISKHAAPSSPTPSQAKTPMKKLATKGARTQVAIVTASSDGVRTLRVERCCTIGLAVLLHAGDAGQAAAAAVAVAVAVAVAFPPL
jgi:hypothetical protein